MKYINFKDLGIITFPNFIEHILMQRIIGNEALSAGFVTCENPKCFGTSGSLDLDSNPDDTEELTFLMRSTAIIGSHNDL
jgi:hypothetical protein